MTVEELIATIKRIIADTQNQDKLTPPRLGPYSALEFIAQAIRVFEQEGE